MPARTCLFVAALAGSSAMAQAPLDTRTLAETAISAREAGDFGQAIALLSEADRIGPNNPTTLRLLGTTYAAARRYDEAIATLMRARSLAPRDQDIALALARAYLWARRYDEAEAVADEIAANNPDNTELPELETSIRRARRGERGADRLVSLGFSQSISRVLSFGARRTWYGSVATVAVPVAERVAVSGEIDREDRGLATDTRLQLRLDRDLGGVSVYLAASTTPNADFRERWGVRAGLDAGMSSLLTLVVDLRYADYGLTAVTAVEPGIRIHTADERLSLTLKSINLWGELDRHQSGWSLRTDGQVTPRLRLIAGGATYPDTEAGITRRVRSAFAGAAVGVGDAVSLRFTYEYEKRIASYRRNGATIGASIRF